MRQERSLMAVSPPCSRGGTWPARGLLPVPSLPSRVHHARDEPGKARVTAARGPGPSPTRPCPRPVRCSPPRPHEALQWGGSGGLLLGQRPCLRRRAEDGRLRLRTPLSPAQPYCSLHWTSLSSPLVGKTERGKVRT